MTYCCNTCHESFNSYSHIKTHQIIHMSNVSWSGVCLCVDGQYTDWATLGMYWTLFLVFGNFFGFLVLFWFLGTFFLRAFLCFWTDCWTTRAARVARINPAGCLQLMVCILLSNLAVGRHYSMQSEFNNLPIL